MKTPKFWFNPAKNPGLHARLLAPLGWLYAAGTARRLRAAPDLVADVPIICIGNINAGGTGKTPMTIALAQHLKTRGLNVHVVSRGHKGTLTGPVQVSERSHSAADVGDEPLLLAAFTTTWISRDRARGVEVAQKAGADAILMDDGFQNPQIQKDISIVVVDAVKGFGNERCIPAGPLREPVSLGMKRAQILLSVGSKKAQRKFEENWGHLVTKPRVQGHLEPLETGMGWAGVNVLAFAGIGHPEKFFATVRALGANVLRAEALADHQPLTEALMKRLELEAAGVGAQLVTTEKDAVRLPASFRRKVLTIPVRLELEDWSELDQELIRIGLG